MPEDGDDLAGAVGHGPRKGFVEPAQLGLASHQWRVEPPGDPGRVREDLLESVGGHGVRLAP